MRILFKFGAFLSILIVGYVFGRGIGEILTALFATNIPLGILVLTPVALVGLAFLVRGWQAFVNEIEDAFESKEETEKFQPTMTPRDWDAIYEEDEWERYAQKKEK